MKALKIIGIIIVVIIAIVVIGGLVTPKTFHFEKSISINAPQETVWSQTNNFTTMVKWMPWMKMDPNMQSGIEGTDGTVGAKYWWKGDKNVGEGSMTIKSMTPPEKTEIDLHFITPFESHALTTISTLKEGEGTKVTWAMDGENPFPMNFIGKIFFDMDAMLDKDFGKGLADLKTMSEQQSSAAAQQ